MGKIVVLDNIAHGDVRILTTPHARFGDNVSTVTVVPAEFPRLIADYPIFFRREGGAGRFELVALMGFSAGENLFLTDGGWDVEYVPLHVRRQPFSISTRYGSEMGRETTEHLLSIDLASPRVSYSDGERLFLDQGGASDYLQMINAMMAELVDGVHATRDYVDALQARELIEPIQLEVEFAGGQSHAMQGLHAVNAERLRALSAGEAGALHSEGALELAYLQMASIAHIPALIARKNHRLAQSKAV